MGMEKMKTYTVSRSETMVWSAAVAANNRDEAEGLLDDLIGAEDGGNVNYFETSPVYTVSLVVPDEVHERAALWMESPDVTGDNGMLWTVDIEHGGQGNRKVAELVATMLMESPGGVEFCERHGDEMGELLNEKLVELLMDRLYIRDEQGV